MATKQMYDLAYQFRATKLWDFLEDVDLFAVRFSDGETGYCSVMGHGGEHYALAVYVGEDGLRSLWKTLRLDPMDPIAETEMGCSQTCLMCSFESKDYLSPEELAEVRAYAAEVGKRLAGKNAFAQFTCYRAGRMGWHIEAEEDCRYICEALRAAVGIKGLLFEHSKFELGFPGLFEQEEYVPLFTQADGRWTASKASFSCPDGAWEAPQYENELVTERIRRKKKQGAWECGTTYLPAPIQLDPEEEEAPYYPLALLCVKRSNGRVLDPPVISESGEPQELLEDFTVCLREAGCPNTIYAGDDRCFFLLQDLCRRTGIRLIRDHEPRHLFEAMLDLLDDMEDDDEDDENDNEDVDEDEALEQLCATLMAMSDREFKRMPKAMARKLLALGGLGMIPAELVKRLKELV